MTRPGGGRRTGLATVLAGLARPAGHTVAALGLVTAAWAAVVGLLDVDPVLFRTPAQVWAYLVTGADATAHRAQVGAGLARTLADAAVGLVAGLSAAVAVAVLLVVVRGVAEFVLPIALVVRSVPLVAMAPLLTLVFGRGVLATTVISGIVVFFPALVLTVYGLRAASPHSVALCRAYGAGPWTVARKVMVPTGLPAIAASARMGVPAALVGALLAEWLATGAGLGYQMLQDAGTFEYDRLWASVAVLTLVAVLLYNAAAAVENVLVKRFAGGTP